MTTVTRIATSQDIRVICRFEREAHKTEPNIWTHEFKDTVYEKNLRKIGIDKLENNKIIIALQKETVIGRCDIMIMNSTVDFEPSGYVDWIYVLKGKRAKGIGKALIRCAEEYFKSIGIKSYYLFTAKNEDAQRFYRKQAYKFEKREIAVKEIRTKSRKV